MVQDIFLSNNFQIIMNSMIPSSSSDRNKEGANDLVPHYQTIRNFIGFSGMALPLILMLFTKRVPLDKAIEPSISDYYYTSTGDVLVVILSILAVFLCSYKGYNWKENALTFLAGLAGLGVAFSPTATKYARISKSVHSANAEVPKLLGFEWHLVFAATFFIALSIMSIYYFRLTDAPIRMKGDKLTQKQRRNIIHLVSGLAMLGCMLILVVYFISNAFQEAVGDFPIIFLLETVAVEFFGISWLTKGETFFPDGEHYLTKGYKAVKKSFAQSKN
jgi:hypothetical protein